MKIKTAISLMILASLGLLFNISNCSKGKPTSNPPGPDTTWADVPDINLSGLQPSNFRDEELDLPYYLKHFHTIANSVVETGPNKGFIDISVWRSEKENIPINSMIMENIIALAFFYSIDRPWNPYYGSPEVKVRLEAAFDYLTSLQTPEGLYPGWTPKYQDGGMAFTAFVTKFIGQALVLLDESPDVDKKVLQRAAEAQRKAIMVLLNEDEHYNRGIMFSNQYTNVWAGALSYLSLYSDAEMRQKLQSRLEQSLTDFQSPAGYFYEHYGTDFGYNLGTHHSNLRMAYHYSRGTIFENYFVEKEQKFGSWLNYNAVKEPGREVFTLNRAIEMRQEETVIGTNCCRSFRESPLTEQVAGIRAYGFTEEEIQTEHDQMRANLQSRWPVIEELEIGSFSAYSPYAFLHRSHYRWHPTEQQKQASINALPYIADNKFNHQKKDSRNPIIFTYVRQPGYYAAFNSGPTLSGKQRYGLGLLWHPKVGSFMQAQTGSNTASWGTKLSGAEEMYEADDLEAIFKVDGQQVEPQIGARDLPQGTLTVEYMLGDIGSKSITFSESEIQVSVTHPGPFSEYVPLLVSEGENAEITRPGMARLTKGQTSITIGYDSSAEAFLIPAEMESGNQDVVVLNLEAEDELRYSIAINN